MPQRGKNFVKICVRTECSPVFTCSRNGELADSASSSGRYVRRASQTLHRAIRPVDRDVDVEAERVVAPDDVAEQLVAHPVVRRVDDPLLLPRAPRVRAGRAEREAEAVGELAELGTALGDERDRVGEGLAAARPDLDLGRDQLTDEMRLELGALRGCLQLLEAVRRARGVSGSRIANSSSTATVKSVADSNCSRPSRSCSSPLRTRSSATARGYVKGLSSRRATPAQLQRSTTARLRRLLRARARSSGSSASSRRSFAARSAESPVVKLVRSRYALRILGGDAAQRSRRGRSGSRRAAASRRRRPRPRPCRTPRGRSTARPSRR